MMKRFLTSTIVAFTLFLSVTLAFADIGTRERREYRNKVKETEIAHAKKDVLPQGLVVNGIILSISLESKTLKLSTPEGQLLDISLGAFWEAGEEGSLQGLKVGQNVKVTYNVTSTENLAQFVEILPEAGLPKKSL